MSELLAHERARMTLVERDMVIETRERCGAVTRRGEPCGARPVRAGGRCKWHGGCSTGPRTAEGKAKVAMNLPRISAMFAGSKSDVGTTCLGR